MIALSAFALVSLVSAVIGLAILLGGAVAVLFSQLKKNTNQIIRDENDDLTRRLKTVETKEEECKERLSKQEATTKVLTDMVTGTTAVADLSTVVAGYHAELVNRLDALDHRHAELISRFDALDRPDNI